uniref:Uncharacterized protein n=1 Tax=Lutzomyia longipalpis TaxID=7200 RepID=A0A1B0CY36_LUTLO
MCTGNPCPICRDIKEIPWKFPLVKKLA